MPDNINYGDMNGNPQPVRTDEIAAVHWQIFKTAFGVAGVATLVSDANPLPVEVI